jgi:hypothetical protein
VFEYIETIYRALKPGGLWVNMGPLLYHWVEDLDHNHDERYNKSIEVFYTYIYIRNLFLNAIYHFLRIFSRYYFFSLYCIMLYCIVLYCIVLYCIVLY